MTILLYSCSYERLSHCSLKQDTIQTWNYGFLFLVTPIYDIQYIHVITFHLPVVGLVWRWCALPGCILFRFGCSGRTNLWICFVLLVTPSRYIQIIHVIATIHLPVGWYSWSSTIIEAMFRFWRRTKSEWFFETASLAYFPKSGMTPAKILQTLRFPGSAVFHRRVEAFRLRVAVYTMLYSYTYTKPLCMYVDFTGARWLRRRLAFPAHTFKCKAPHPHSTTQ